LLADDLGTIDGRGFTLMSDQQKRLLNGIQNVWPGAEQSNVLDMFMPIFVLFMVLLKSGNAFWVIAK